MGAGSIIPAGVYAENQGTSTGNALRVYTATSSISDLVVFYQEGTQTFASSSLLMEMGKGTGAFTGNFLDLRNNSLSKFIVSANGTTTIGDGVTNAGLQIIKGGLCVDSDGSCTASTSGRITAVEYITANSDLAENYLSDEVLEPGDVVQIAESSDNSHTYVKKSNGAGTLIGIVSTRPGITLGSSYEVSSSVYPIALAGRVPLKISLENGPIHTGDKLTPSSVSGIAMRARPSDAVIGYALEDYTGASGDSALVTSETTKIYKPSENLKTYFVDNRDYSGGAGSTGETEVQPPKAKIQASNSIVSLDTKLSSATSSEQIPVPNASSIPKIMAFVKLGHASLDITNYEYFANASSSQGWFVDQQTGAVKKGYFIDVNSADLVNVRSILSASGTWSINESGKLIVEEIQTKKLKVGTSEHPTGITLYDSATGQPYCLRITNGIPQSMLGECGSQQGNNQTQSVPTESPPSSSASPSVSEGSDTESPVIIIQGNNPAEIEIGQTYGDLGVLITDNLNQNIGYTTTVNGLQMNEIQIDTSIPGEHTIIYTATDQAGNTTTASRIVKVIDPHTTSDTVIATSTSDTENISESTVTNP